MASTRLGSLDLEGTNVFEVTPQDSSFLVGNRTPGTSAFTAPRTPNTDLGFGSTAKQTFGIPTGTNSSFVNPGATVDPQAFLTADQRRWGNIAAGTQPLTGPNVPNTSGGFGEVQTGVAGGEWAANSRGFDVLQEPSTDMSGKDIGDIALGTGQLGLGVYSAMQADKLMDKKMDVMNQNMRLAQDQYGDIKKFKSDTKSAFA